MKKGSIITTIVGLVLGLLGTALLLLTPTLLYLIQGEAYRGPFPFITGPNFSDLLTATMGEIITSAKNVIKTLMSDPGNLLNTLTFAVSCLAFIMWPIHLVVLIVRKRPSSLVPNIFYFLGSFVTFFVIYSLIVPGLVLRNDIIAIMVELMSDFGANWAEILFLGLTALLAIAAFVLETVGIILAIVDCAKHPGNIASKSAPEDDYAAEGADVDDDLLKAAQYDELDAEYRTNAKKDSADDGFDYFDDLDETEKVVTIDPPAAPSEQPAAAEKGKGDLPYIVQNIYYGSGVPAPAQPQAQERDPRGPIHIHLHEKKKPEAEKAVSETPILKEADIRSIIAEELSRHLTQEKKVEEPKDVAPIAAPVVEENRPLTARELRSIIKEALDDHEHPDNDKPLTDDEARSLIREELGSYYAWAYPIQKDEPLVEEKEETPEVEEKPAITTDDLRSIIREELSTIVKEPEEEKKAEVVEEVKEPVLTAEEIRSIVAAEMAALYQKTKEDEEALSKDAALKLEEQRKVDTAQNEAIEAIKESLVSAETLRTIVSEELEKKVQNIKVTPEPAVQPIPQVVVHVPPAPVAEPAPVKEVESKAAVPINDGTKAKIVRIPFPTRLLSSEQDVKDLYNELKGEILSYGLKSRLSNSGDTFRLHTKTYVKLTVAGKGLKLYFALNPKDYVDSPIPVKDVGAKNIYKDIPVVFKVKSPLSLKRAKQLIADCCEKDNLEQEKVADVDYVAQLKNYKPQNSGGIDDDEDDD